VNARAWAAVSCLAAAAALSASAGGEAGNGKPSIEDLEVALSGERVVVSFRLVGGLDDEALERIHSGIALTFRHRLDVVAKRAMPLVPAKVLARSRVASTVEYDSLTRRYHLYRSVEHESDVKKLAPPIDETTATTNSLDEVRSWMTEFRDLLVYDPSRTFPERELRIRVRSSLSRRYVMWIFPSTVSASAERTIEP